MRESCYATAGVKVDTSPMCGTTHDTILNSGATVLHRVACHVRNGESGLFVDLSRKVAGFKTSYDLSTAADFYAILVRTKDSKDVQVVSKMFFFPREVFAQVVTAPGGPALHVMLYPSNVKPKQRRSIAKQQLQVPYEIDLTRPLDENPVEKEKFLRILKEGSSSTSTSNCKGSHSDSESETEIQNADSDSHSNNSEFRSLHASSSDSAGVGDAATGTVNGLTSSTTTI